jgi:hypothetical protein
MNGNLRSSVGAAARAAWWVVLVGVAWVCLGYRVWLWMMSARPDWVLVLCGGGDLGWEDVQRISLMGFGAFKIVLFATVLAAVWLSLWSQGLKRAA